MDLKNWLWTFCGWLLSACQATGVQSDGVPAYTETAVPVTPAVQAPLVPAARLSFDQWIATYQRQAAARGISQATLQQAFAGVSLNQRVLELDQRQPEFTRPIWEYLDNAISDRRIANGRQLLVQYGDLLREVGQRFGVDPQYIVAIWGLESDYGRAYGDFNVIEVLATLAYQGRRQDFGREQLFAALKILDKGDIAPSRMLGSWAGAMGHTQFIPTTYLDYAVDYDNDGKRDLWNSLSDVFASTANYLAAVGRWQMGESWGFEVRLPADFNWDLSDPTVRKPLSEWQLYGIRRIDGGDLPKSADLAAVLAPAGHRGPAFLIMDNFRAILRYNNATSYALAVGQLADRITGKSPIVANWPTSLQPLSRTHKIELQQRLKARGYELGAVDGIVGPRTRAAVKRFQKEINEPSDGYPTVELLDKLRDFSS